MIEVLEAVVKQVPPPKGDLDAPPRALVFDSHYDSYKGVVAYVRVVDGKFDRMDDLHMIATDVDFRPVEIGVFAPQLQVHRQTPGWRGRLYRHRVEDRFREPGRGHSHSKSKDLA